MTAACANCGAPQQQSAGFCDQCGKPLQSARLACAICAEGNEPDARFCKGCGASLRARPGPLPTPARPAAPAAKAPAPLATPQSFAGLYHFVRSHLLVVNSLVGFASTSVALLDFLSPRLSVLPRLIYASTATLALVLLIVAFVPRVDRWLLGRWFPSDDPGHRLWRRGGWQFAVLLLALVTGFGFESVAKASQGGVLAAGFPAVKDWQRQFLQLREGMGQVQAGVAHANTQLKVLLDAQHDASHLLRARGYKISSQGLATAIDTGDEQAVGLFAQLDFRVTQPSPILALLGRHGGGWDPRIGNLLRPSMFTAPRACSPIPASRLQPLIGHLEQRCQAFARLCGPAEFERAGPLLARLQQALQVMETTHRFLGVPADAAQRQEARAYVGRLTAYASSESRWQDAIEGQCVRGFPPFPPSR